MVDLKIITTESSQGRVDLDLVSYDFTKIKDVSTVLNVGSDVNRAVSVVQDLSVLLDQEKPVEEMPNQDERRSRRIE